jgi:rhodanese-related sulfurtransferase
MSLKTALMKALVVAVFSSIVVMAADKPDAIAPTDLITTSQLNNQLAAVNSGKIVLIHVGFHTMYGMAHIPGSKYVGAASQAEGLAALQKLVASLPRNQQIVIYCGCCPWSHCPNIRPAFATLKEMGFTNLKALYIPQRFGDDWTAKGYPVANGE